MRLIDADKINFNEVFIGASEFGKDLKETAQSLIDAQPTVEAVPVVHGEWIYNQYHTWECANCGFHPFKGFIPKEPGFNFCPNCGADMRKKV